MSNTKTLRRCGSCGSNVRQNSRFCPRCGGKMNGDGKESLKTNVKQEPIVKLEPAVAKEKATNTNTNLVIETPSTENIANTETTDKPIPPTKTLSNSNDGNMSSANVTPISSPPHVQHETNDKGLLPKVEKLKQVSHEMLDEAAIDPSLRFLLIAAFIFIVFVVFLILNTLM
jgi:hypothetical protein